MLWIQRQLGIVKSIAVSPDGKTVAVGYYGPGNTPAGVVLLAASTGQQTGSIPDSEELNFRPSETFPQGSSGVSGLVFSPDSALLYGTFNHTLFAWRLGERALGWQRTLNSDPGQADDLLTGCRPLSGRTPAGCHRVW